MLNFFSKNANYIKINLTTISSFYPFYSIIYLLCSIHIIQLNSPAIHRSHILTNNKLFQQIGLIGLNENKFDFDKFKRDKVEKRENREKERNTDFLFFFHFLNFND